MADGFGGSPWGMGWGGGSDDQGGSAPAHIPVSDLWDVFDLSGVRSPDDITNATSFIEVSVAGNPAQFFPGSFNIASGGGYPALPAIFSVDDLPVSDGFTVEWRVVFRNLPSGFDTLTDDYVLMGVNSAAGACATLLISQDGIAYTGAYHFNGSNEVVLDHVLNPGGVTVEERSTQYIPGSHTWITEGIEYFVRLVADWESDLVYLYVTPAAQIHPSPELGVVDSTGHVLRAMLRVLPYDTSTVPPIDRISVAANGQSGQVRVELTAYQLSTAIRIPNLPPRARAGADQAVNTCSIVQLDGSASYDPEGSDLTYQWRLTETPENSAFCALIYDGYTEPLSNPNGYTDLLYSDEVAALDATNPIVPGDVVRLGASAVTIADKLYQPFRLRLESVLPDNLTGARFRILRQSSVTGPTTARPTFYPDKPGFYLFDLRVHDGLQWSDPTGVERAVTLVNVVESALPRGVTPNLDFVFNYLSDFWHLVEDSELFQTFWSALAQVASSELYTLWQTEYGKSIRDIQRTFVRRWLHYDLLLGEPVPELTKTGVIACVYDSAVALVADWASLGGTAITVTSAVAPYDPITVSVDTGPVAVQLEHFVAWLTRLLTPLGISARWMRMDDGATQYAWLRLTSTAPFAVTNVTGPAQWLFDLKAARYPQGVAYRLAGAARSLFTSFDFEGYDLTGSLIVIEGKAYHVAYVVNTRDPLINGDFPYCCIVTREDIPTYPTDDATETRWELSGWVSSSFLNFYDGLVTAGDHVDVELDGATLVQVPAVAACETEKTKLAVNLLPVAAALHGGATLGLARVLRRTYLPVDPLVADVPTLTASIVITDDTATLRRNLDYFIEDVRGRRALRFVTGTPDVWEGARPPDRLWAEYTYIDNAPTIEANFGKAVGLTREHLESLPDGVDYLSAVRGLMYTLTGGPSVYNIRVGTQILLGLPFAEATGTIAEVRKDLLSDTGRILVRDDTARQIVRSYTFPRVLDVETNPVTGEPYAVGDTVTEFAPLVAGVRVLDYVNDPHWFKGLIGQGSFYEVNKFHTFVIRVDSDAFRLDALLLAREFVFKVKPGYTTPRFIVSLNVSGDDGDEIGVNDTNTYRGTLRLYDDLSASHLGAAGMFDEPWPSGDRGTATRNQFDRGVDPDVESSENILWGFDKEYLYPSDSLSAELTVTYAVPTVPQLDAGFSFDNGATSVAHADTVAAPVVLPAGAGGLLLEDFVGLGDGTISKIRFIFFGETGAGTHDFEILIFLDNVLMETVPVTCDVNRELIHTLSVPVTSTQAFKMVIRASDLTEQEPEWAVVNYYVYVSVPWQFDTPLTGTFVGTRVLSEGV